MKSRTFRMVGYNIAITLLVFDTEIKWQHCYIKPFVDTLLQFIEILYEFVSEGFLCGSNVLKSSSVCLSFELRWQHCHKNPL